MVGTEQSNVMSTRRYPSLSSLGPDENTSFLRAARAGHLDKVLELLRHNVDINTSNSNGLNALHLASKDGHVAVVKELLKRGARADSATKKGNTALHIASLAGQEEVVKLLVEHGASVNVQSQNGFTPLYMAAQENHDDVVKYLLVNGAIQGLATEDGFTPIAVAMQQGHDKVVTVLLENGSQGKARLPALHIAAKNDDCKAAALLLEKEHNPDVTSKSGFTPLHIASHYGNENIANLLLNAGADVNYSAKHNITPLHVAAKWGRGNMVSLLLAKGANIESRTRDGLTPLHCAARSGYEKVVDMLLERQAPISSKTKNGLAPLHMASQGDHVDAARILLYHKAPVDEVTVDYLTALHVAAHCGHVRVAKLLLDRKADPNARALNGFTPLHIACKKNRSKVVEVLLKHGGSIEATTESGLTPLHVASFMGCMNIVIYLLQNEANPDVPTVRGETPLHLAARANQTDIIRILLRNGAQVDARAREQQTPLHIASRLGNVDIVMLLLQHGATVDCTTKDLYSALHIAAKEGQDEVAAVLLENGSSPMTTTKKGFTPLHLAAKHGNMNVARLLLQRDAPVDAQGKNGVTPLHVASHYDHQNVALLLLEKGASPHATAKNGHTPLHIAAKKNQMDIATTLLEYGAKANAESKAGFTPLHLSAQEGHSDISSLLIDHHANTNHKAKNGLTPLHLCAQEDCVNVASIIVKNGAEINTTTKAGYTPLHIACHCGQLPMVKFLLEENGDVAATTAVGYTPLHQAAQQGHCAIVNSLLDRGALPNATTNQGQTALSIAQKLGYISVVETLKGVTELSTIMPTGTDEKYKVVSPETMQETFMSDSEDEGGEDTLLSEQPYRYLTVDEMKSLGDDSLPIDVRQDERQDSNRECMTVPPTAAVDDTISPQHIKEAYSHFTTTDNIDITKHPLHVGFLVSFLVDARGGAMRGCRHSGVRVIVPPRRASMPVRVTCRYLKRDKLTHLPPLMEGEALASRILELGPVGAKFLGPVMIEVPHFGSLRRKEREIVILRSDNGETWREHTGDCSEEAVQDVLNNSFEKEDLNQLEENVRTTRILTTDFPHYFAVVTRVRQEVHAIGPEGGMVSSSVVPQVQAVFPQGALTKKIKVGLQAQPISKELAAKLLGNRVAVSPIVTVEPRRRKFHKPITLTIPKPQAANKGMINQYSGDAPTLRLLCSITGGTTRAQWEDVTGSTPFTFVNDCVSFTTTVSARFWLMDCRNVGDATKMATELYREAIHVPFMAKFVVFAKRVDPLEARLRVFCMTDDKEDKTLEQQENFTEIAKSRDVEVLEGKPQYIEFALNLVPVTKSGEQLQLGFHAFRENRLPFTVRVKDPHADCLGRTIFMREAKLPKGEPSQNPICILNIVLPDEIIPEAILPEHELHKYSYIQDSSGLESYQKVDLRVTDISNLLGEDWPLLAEQLDVAPSYINRIKSEQPHSVAQQALAMLRLWLSQAGNKAQASTLEMALSRIGRDDIVQECVFNIDQSGLQLLKEESRDASSRRNIPNYEIDTLKDSEFISRTAISKKEDGLMEKDDKEERKYEAEEKEVEEVKKSVSERRKEIEKRLSLDKPTEKKTETIVSKVPLENGEELSEKEIAEEKVVSSPDNEPSILSFEQKRLSFEQGKRVIEMKPDTTTMKEVKEMADERLLIEERRLAEAQNEIKSLVDETSIPFQIKRKSFEQGVKEESSKQKIEALKKEELRRDSALFEGVSQGLIHLDAAFTAAPIVQDLLSPKVSKTPPPSPAEPKNITGTAAWTDDSPDDRCKPDQPKDWAEKGKPDLPINEPTQGLPRAGTKEGNQSKLEDEQLVSVTSKSTLKITESNEVRTVNDLDKDVKYQFTMTIQDKQTFEDTFNSIAEFLETEKNLITQQYKQTPEKITGLEVVTMSDKTNEKQSNETKLDKSFMGKVSKRLFGVFKKDDKENPENKQTKKLKKDLDKITHIESSNDSKITDKIKSRGQTLPEKILNEEKENNGISLPSKYGQEVEGKQLKPVDERVDIEKPTIDIRNVSPILEDLYDVKNTQSTQLKELSIFLTGKSDVVKGEIGKSENSRNHQSNDFSKGKDKSVDISKTILEESQPNEVIINDTQNGNDLITVDLPGYDSKNPSVDGIGNTKPQTDNSSGESTHIFKEGIILDVHLLSDSLKEHLAEENECTGSKNSKGPTVNVKSVEITEDITNMPRKGKSKSFFGAIFNKSKEDEKADVITIDPVNLESGKTSKLDMNVVEELNNIKNNIAQDQINDNESSPFSKSEQLTDNNDHLDELNLNMSDRSAEKVKTNQIKPNKEKSKSFFGSIFSKVEPVVINDENHTTGDNVFFVPVANEDVDIQNDKAETNIIKKNEVLDGTIEVWEITKYVEDKQIPATNTCGEALDLYSQKTKCIAPNMVISPQSTNIEQHITEPKQESTTTDFNKTFPLTAESNIQEKDDTTYSITEITQENEIEEKTNNDITDTKFSPENYIKYKTVSISVNNEQNSLEHKVDECSLTTDKCKYDGEKNKKKEITVFNTFHSLTPSTPDSPMTLDNIQQVEISIKEPISKTAKTLEEIVLRPTSETEISKANDVADDLFNKQSAYFNENTKPQEETVQNTVEEFVFIQKDLTEKCTYLLSPSVETACDNINGKTTPVITDGNINADEQKLMFTVSDSSNVAGITDCSNLEASLTGTLFNHTSDVVDNVSQDKIFKDRFKLPVEGSVEVIQPYESIQSENTEEFKSTHQSVDIIFGVEEKNATRDAVRIIDEKVIDLSSLDKEKCIKDSTDKNRNIESTLPNQDSLFTSTNDSIISYCCDSSLRIGLTEAFLPESHGLDEMDRGETHTNNLLESDGKGQKHDFVKLSPVEQIQNISTVNEDKLNNILIDMLIEQECITSQLPDHQTSLTIAAATENSTSVPEKHDSEISEKQVKEVNPPSSFNNAASFGHIESLINDEKIKRDSASDLASQHSYVTTPTMQRRKIGGSQRLSREERPALRELLYMENYSSSDEDDTSYIVTEPSERIHKRTVTFQVDSEDEVYLKTSDCSSEAEVEVTEMTPSPDPTSRKQVHVPVEGGSFFQEKGKEIQNTSEVNPTNIERRFDRMASEILSEDLEVKFVTDREFQRMVSQLSNEEVDACLTQWDEEGLTPLEELDSIKDTVEGDFGPEMEALPEALLGSPNQFYSASPQWSTHETNTTITQESGGLAFALNNAAKSPKDKMKTISITALSKQDHGDLPFEGAKKSSVPPTSKEREEALLDQAASPQDSNEAGAVPGPSSSK